MEAGREGGREKERQGWRKIYRYGERSVENLVGQS